MKIPEGQLTDRSDKPSLTITGIVGLEIKAVRFVDETGKERAELLVRAEDGELYLAPDGASWVGNLRPLTDRMRDNVEAALRWSEGARAHEIPMDDNVDVVASAISQENADEAPPAAG